MFGDDGFAEDEFERGAVGRRVEVPGMHGEQVADADEGDGNKRHLASDGEEGGSVEEILEIAIGGATAFGEDEDAEAVAEGLDAGGEAGQGGAGVGGVNGDLARAVEIPADEGEGPQLFFCQDAELEGKAGEDDRRIHVRGVVGGEDGGFGGDVFEADHLKLCAGEKDAGVGPDVGDAVLEAARFVEERGEQRKTAEDGGGEDEWRGQKKVAALAGEVRKRVWSH